MTRFFKYALMAAVLCIGVASCSDEDHPDPVPPTNLPVNYANLSGNWQLIGFNDHLLEEGTYVYISFDRRNHTFKTLENMSSMYAHEYSGTYALEEGEKTETTLLSLFYDHSMGARSSEYTVTALGADRLELTSTKEPREVQTFVRISAFPELSQ